MPVNLRLHSVRTGLRCFSTKVEPAGTIINYKTVYKRPLSENLISFSSKEGIQLFKESLDAGYMHNYFSLAE